MNALASGQDRSNFGLRVFIYTAGAALVIALAIFLYFLQKNHETLEATLLVRGETASQLLAENLRLAAFTEDQEAAARALETLKTQKDLAGLAVHTGNGKVLAAWASPAWDSAMAGDTESWAGGLPAPGPSGRALMVEGKSAYHFWSPILSRPRSAEADELYQLQAGGVDEGGVDEGGRVIGFVRLTYTKEGLQPKRADLIVKSAALGALLLLVCAIVTLLVLRLAAAPLARLAEQLGSTGSPKGRKYFWSALTDPYSELVGELNHSVSAINDLNVHLEKMVSQRTGELSKANELLGREVEERQRLIEELQQAASEIKRLEGYLPTCANCRKIRDENGKWVQMETYITQRTEAQFSHGICEDCADELYPDFRSKGPGKGPAGKGEP